MHIYFAGMHGCYAPELLEILYKGVKGCGYSSQARTEPTQSNISSSAAGGYNDLSPEIRRGGGTDMKLYLAGGIQANLKPYWRELLASGDRAASMKIFLAGAESRQWILQDVTKGRASLTDSERLYNDAMKLNRPYILESFFYADEDTESLIPYFGDFLLDSGAFTFFTLGKKIDWNDYLERYAAFIKKNKVKKFFELDIDKVVGYELVKQFRRRLERDTGIQPIPVWHKSRGKEEFLRMCDEYKHVSIGGIVSKEITPDEYRFFPWFIDQAHKRGCTIHGLGFTNLKGLERYHFDSVDSTSWTTGNRFGYIYRFNGRTMEKVKVPPGHRICNPRKAALQNFIEWMKFQQYAERNL